ncbi:RIP metalloprotease RseP [Methylacidiphilum caldifontis]|uniref:RIP metalloprotease RseP n=1 Tax=Methylacidiphilum caldifontis TaxID=2795386 RepID=UPI001A8EB48E|nr:RIP metalloprotease RseP [Methylacidiphilum caldifontis]QSR89567.1 RIP metalloprotease RseP [Methylacidiphilum caldifontis]
MSFQSLLHFLVILLEVVFLFNVMIVVHELGHFLAAKWRGLVVERFGVWFGHPLWKKEIGGVTYSLGWIPAGGFVALPQMIPNEDKEGENNSSKPKLPPVSPKDKIIVALAGPVFSLLLALVFALIVYVVGRPVSESEMTTVIGYVVKDSPADHAGLKAGDKILKIDGHPVSRFQGMDNDSVTWNIVRSEGSTIAVEVEREGKILNFNVIPIKEERSAFQRKSLRQIFIMPAQTPTVAKVFPGSPADAASIQPNDQILEVDGQKLYSPFLLNDYISTHLQKEMTLLIRRGKKTFTVNIKPTFPEGEKIPRIGILWDLNGQMTLSHPGPFEQLKASISAMFNVLQAVLSPKSDIKPQHLSGPIGIMRFYYMLFESSHGWRLALWFSVLFNVNAALINLFPIPVLDGGHILLGLVEWIRGRPLNIKLLEALQTLFATLLIGYMLYVTFFDVQEIPWRSKGNVQELKFHSKNQEAVSKSQLENGK